VTDLVVDTSVVVKWFHGSGESEIEPARSLLAAHAEGAVVVGLTDLVPYELGNILVRSLGWSAQAVADQLDDLLVICGPPVPPSPVQRRDAAALAVQHGLTYYDASFAAAARSSGVPLVTADRALLGAGLGISATQAVEGMLGRPR
jgi:predicted nucleic acid-binding protein